MTDGISVSYDCMIVESRIEAAQPYRKRIRVDLAQNVHDIFYIVQADVHERPSSS